MLLALNCIRAARRLTRYTVRPFPSSVVYSAHHTIGRSRVIAQEYRFHSTSRPASTVSMYPPIEPYETGKLKVSDLHTL